jgi:hypothetical protein
VPKVAPTLLRLSSLLALAVLVLSLATAERARADAAQVTVVSPGGTQQTISLGALTGQEDVIARPYVLRAASGETTQTLSGFSLAAILDAAGADPYGFSYLEVQRPAGGSVLLSRDQAIGSGAFADGPPLVHVTASGTSFLRPSADSEDLNASDSFEAPQGISIVLHKGQRLQVRAKASTLRTAPGKPISFSAIVERAGSGEQLAYSWQFDDGQSAEGPEASHSFAKRGSYDVVVGVTSDGDKTGGSAVVTIQVGKPLAGPNRKGGGTNDDAGAPDHGAADPAEPGSSGKTGSLATAGQAGQTPPAARLPAEPSVSPSTPTPPESKPEREPASGERVVGELVSSTTDFSPPPAKQAAARSGRLDGNGGGGGGIPGAAWGLLATVSLFGAGALIETRNLFG